VGATTFPNLLRAWLLTIANVATVLPLQRNFPLASNKGKLGT